MKSSKKRAVKEAEVEANKKYEDDNSSDDEMPEVVSNATMKSNYDVLKKQLQDLKQQLREAEKSKRRRKQEVCVAQKKTKQAKISQEDDGVGTGSSKEKESQQDSGQTSAAVTAVQSTKMARKVYPSLNITVEPLKNVKDSRATAALDFRSRRLNKVPRESVKSAVISYQKKLKVRK